MNGELDIFMRRRQWPSASYKSKQRCSAQIKDTKIPFVLMGHVHGLDVRVIKMTSSQNRHQKIVHENLSNALNQMKSHCTNYATYCPKTKEQHRYSSISTLSAKEAALLIENNNETACAMLSLDRQRQIFSGRILSPW